MQAWLVVNEFLRNEKFQLVKDWFTLAAKEFGIQLLTKTNATLMINLSGRSLWGKGERPDFVLFWDKDVRLAKYLEGMGIRVFNSAKAIAICDDKAYTHMVLNTRGIPMPKTILAPMTYKGVGYTDFDFLNVVEEALSYPIILKECFGSFGQQVYKMKRRGDMEGKLRELAGTPLLFQEFIESSFARDVRLQVVGNRVVASIYRYSDTGDFRANVTNGAKMKPYQPTKGQCQLAIRCCEAIGLDFAGVDLLFGEGEEPLVCEVNSNAHFKNIYDCTGINVAEAIMAHIASELGS